MTIDELTAKVRGTLLKSWDPIGVSEVPQAQDEYDSYAPAVVTLVMQGASVQKISAHLLAIERDRMGLPGNPALAEQAAKLLLALGTR